MNTPAFTTAYNASRNGANFFVRHPLVRGFQVSDGVQACADAGMHWLLDIAATELPAIMRAHNAYSAILEVTVKNTQARLKLTAEDDAPPLWSRKIDWTDMPQGQWDFELADEGERVAMILISEH